jgi:ABC-type Fe3+ transport system permease subunit
VFVKKGKNQKMKINNNIELSEFAFTLLIIVGTVIAVTSVFVMPTLSIVLSYTVLLGYFSFQTVKEWKEKSNWQKIVSSIYIVFLAFFIIFQIIHNWK